MATPETVRPCMVCGTFYPADRAALAAQVDRLLDAAVPRKAMDVRGLVAPHAGYMYSGFTAAHAYALLRRRAPEVVVIIAPSHRDAFEGVSVYPGSAYATPLGDVPVHAALRTKLLAASHFVRAGEAGHRGEHAVEVQLPFLQRTIGAVSLLPLVMGDQRPVTCRALGTALAGVLAGADALIIASTDLSHFHSKEIAEQLDALVIDDVRRGDPDGLLGHLGRGEAEACGGGPTAAALFALHGLGVTRMRILHHCTSADVTGDASSVVGYLSAAAIA